MVRIFRHKRNNDTRNIMDLIPSPLCETRRSDEEGTVDLLMPRFKSSWLSRLVPPKKDPHIFIHLDKLGTFFWEQVDGQKTVLEIGRLMVEMYPDDMKDGLERAGKFAQMLHQQGFISLS